MARFRGTIQGNRGEASRLGTKGSGLGVTCNGWNGGVSVYADVNTKDEDVFYIYATAGSGYGLGEGLICKLDQFGRAINN